MLSPNLPFRALPTKCCGPTEKRSALRLQLWRSPTRAGSDFFHPTVFLPIFKFPISTTLLFWSRISSSQSNWWGWKKKVPHYFKRDAKASQEEFWGQLKSRRSSLYGPVHLLENVGVKLCNHRPLLLRATTHVITFKMPLVIKSLVLYLLTRKGNLKMCLQLNYPNTLKHD